MNWTDQIALFSTLDMIAVCGLVGCWLAVGWAIELSPRRYPSMSSLMADFRREWMVQMVTREPRIFDAQIVSSLRQGTAFFASTCMIAIGGGLALIGSADQLAVVANDLTLDADPIIVWEVKLLVMLLFVTNGFLKFVWANRLFGYCSVLLAAVPNDAEHPDVYARAAQAGEIGVAAGRGFNRGLRSIYFALANAAWLLGAVPLMIATIVTVIVLFRREFASRSRSILLSNPAPTQS
ncbi:MAG: DUF599 domain-containing protein [Paracoccaceae bacterium]